MGAIRTKLESFKQPRTVKSSGRVRVPNLTPKGGSGGGKGLDYSKAFWMARAVQKDEQGAQSSKQLADASASRRQGSLDNAANLGKVLDQLNLEADNLLSSLPTD